MFLRSVLKATAILMALTPLTQANHGQPCGLRTAPCPDDQHCVPHDPVCTNMDRCSGSCQYKNTYPSCGGFRVEPQNCDAEDQCKDDPREPDSCGMACDRPGICIPIEQPTCDPEGGADEQCPEGLTCFKWPEKEYLVGGDGECGVCL